MSNKERNQLYIDIVKSLCDMLNLLNSNAPIYRSAVGRLWNEAGKQMKNKESVPGFLMSEGMDQWAKEHNRQLLFDVSPSGKRSKVRIV